MAKFDKKQLHNLTKLCRINCSDEEIETFHDNMQSILGHFDQLSEIDTDGVKECNHVCDTTHNAMREDDPTENLPREKFLENSPSHVGGMIRVPPVIKF